MTRPGPRLLAAALVLSSARLVAFPPATAQSITGQIFRPIGCTISATAVAFGNYDVTALLPQPALGAVTYSCHEQDNGHQLTKRIDIHLSTGFSGTYDSRAMTRGGADRLLYNLYLDSNFRNIWGDGSRGTDEFTDRPRNDETNVVTIYGRLFERQDVASGGYIDIIQVTILF